MLNKSKGTIKTLKQKSINSKDIENMVKPENVDIELKELFPCLQCDGTGKRWKAVANEYGILAGDECKSETDYYDEIRKKKKNNDTTTASATTNNDNQSTRKKFYSSSTFFQNGPVDIMESDDEDTSSEEEDNDSELDYEEDDFVYIPPVSINKCWVCHGTGTRNFNLLNTSQMENNQDHKMWVKVIPANGEKEYYCHRETKERSWTYIAMEQFGQNVELVLQIIVLVK